MLTCAARCHAPHLLTSRSSACFNQSQGQSSRVRPPENRSLGRAMLKGNVSPWSSIRLGFAAADDSAVSATKSPSDGGDSFTAFLRATELLCVAVAATLQLYQWSNRPRRNESEAIPAAVPRLVKTHATASPLMSANPLPTSATVFAIIMALVANVLLRWRTADRSASCGWGYNGTVSTGA